MIKRLEKITINDYPPEVQAHVKQLRLGEEALTDDLPAQFKTEHMQTFVNWDQSKAKSYGEILKLATWDDWAIINLEVRYEQKRNLTQWPQISRSRKAW